MTATIADTEKTTSTRNTKANDISVGIKGMHCASCVAGVEKALTRVESVTSAEVNLATEHARIRAGSTLTATAVQKAVADAGYSVADTTTKLAVRGMTCASCVGRIERALGRVPGVLDTTVNLATGKASIRHIPGMVDTTDLIATVNTAGYDATPVGDRPVHEEGGSRSKEAKSLKRSVLLAMAATLPLFVLEMGGHVSDGLHEWLFATVGQQNLFYLYFVLATMVQFGPGRYFYRTGWPTLARGTPDMNSLVMLGATAAYGYSVVATFLPSVLPAGTAHVYYEAAAMIITLILVGRYLEALSMGRTGEAIKRLMQLEAKTARVLRDGEATDVPLEAVQVGDVVQVRPGEKVPVDGTIIKGSSYIDESMITGEPNPVHKTTEAKVVGGTINGTGSFSFRATEVGSDTMLARIIHMVETAQGAKLPIQALVDKVTMYFVPAVMAAAAATFIIWLLFGPAPALSYALVNAVAVLIIACPCAMGLATPTSIMVGTGRAAAMGILFRNGTALQTLHSIDTIALDKTGTLTTGQPTLTDLVVTKGFEHDAVLHSIAAVEAHSEHPIAQAIVDSAGSTDSADCPLSEAADFEALPGYGVSATVDGRFVAIGADRLMARLNCDTSEFSTTAHRLAKEGKTPLYAAIDGQLAAVVSVADPIKTSTPAAIKMLHERGLRVVMITGDNQQTAQAIAARLGIDEVIAEVLPEGKVDAVKKLHSAGHRLAFVGDGINDAPALAEADVGMAIGTGTDVAIESADVILVAGDLRHAADAIGLSRATLANIRQNLFWAFAYNTVLIPVAAGVLYPAFGLLLSPVFAAAAMALSDIFVVSNALRLRRFKPGPVATV